VPVFVDPKQRDVSIYAGATVLSPNLKELAIAAGVDGFADDAAIIEAARHLARKHAFRYVLTTRGEHGMTLVDAEGLVIRVEATAAQVFDVSGAGDTVGKHPGVPVTPAQVAAACVEAVNRCRPATLSHAEVACEGIGHNREYGGTRPALAEALKEI
jgi:bifunctional ADP-heptose synthase (sugar kinase/adenylyltransferase)